MRILEINIIRGPNYWSIRRQKLIVMVLDLEDMENYPSNKIPGFSDRIKMLLPGLYSHRCSEDREGGFYHRVEQGTWMGHIIEHIALEIQTMAGMDTGFGRTRGYGKKGVYNVVFSYKEENVGSYAATAAVRICEALIGAQDYDLDADIQHMRELREAERLGPSTGSIIKEAESRGIPWIRLNKYALCQLGYGANQKRIQATITSNTSSIGVELACDKEDTKYILEKAEVKMPNGRILRDSQDLKDTCDYVGYPLVIKPIDGNHGRGVTVNINTFAEAKVALGAAQEISENIIVEKHITGADYRLLVINHKLVAAAKRSPAHVVGDGKSTISQLIDDVNKDPRRGFGHENVLTAISVNDLTLTLIKKNGYELTSILPIGKTLVLKDTANLSTGGTAEDVTDILHSSNVFMVERISRLIDLDICGVDIMTTDISKPLEETGGAVLEVNAAPGFRMHLAPTVGLPRNVASPVVDQLFPPGTDGRIPIIAVTGTNGKTTTSRLIAHMAKLNGFQVGYTTSDGVYIQNRMLMQGDCTGPKSTEFVLKDPNVNFAVLECARGGILRSGLGFRRCNVGIVTNVESDHLGLKGIHTIDQLAKVKGVIPETVMPDGYAILNADDDRVYAMRDNLECNVALFSMDENNPRILEFQENNGLTAIYESGYVTITRGKWKMRVMKAENIPLTFGGKAGFMIQNVLAAILAGHARRFSIEDMKVALESFIPSPAQTPGRLNLFEFKDFNFLVDYAHNPSGLRALQQFIESMEVAHCIGIIAGIGDRREEDTIKVGEIAAEMFDEIIIRQDIHLRGKTEEELTELLEKGIFSKKIDKKVTHVKSELGSIKFAVEHAKKGALIVLCSDVIPDALKLMQELKEREGEGKPLFQ